MRSLHSWDKELNRPLALVFDSGFPEQNRKFWLSIDSSHFHTQFWGLHPRDGNLNDIRLFSNLSRYHLLRSVVFSSLQHVNQSS